MNYGENVGELYTGTISVHYFGALYEGNFGAQQRKFWCTTGETLVHYTREILVH